ncbi:MAG: hypothetical protein AAGC86_10115 [Pseudomonadota bacterium]
MPRLVCFAFLAALAGLSACEQPARTSGEAATDGIAGAIDRLPKAEGTMTDGPRPAPGTTGL